MGSLPSSYKKNGQFGHLSSKHSYPEQVASSHHSSPECQHSYNQESHSVAREIFMLASKSKKLVSPMYWKSGVIRKICSSPKAAETRGVMKLVDDCINMANQTRILLRDSIKLKVFTDSWPLLESIGSSNQVAEKALRLSVAFLKKNLEDEEVSLLYR